MCVTSTITFFADKLTHSIVLFICRVCPCKLCNLTCSSSVIIRPYLSCIRSELVKLHTAIHERFGHVSHSSLKRVVSPDSPCFWCPSIKRVVHGSMVFWFPDCVVVSFCKSPHHSWCCLLKIVRETPLQGDRLHCQLSGFLANLVFILALQIAVILGAGSAWRLYNGTVQIDSSVKFQFWSTVSK